MFVLIKYSRPEFIIQYERQKKASQRKKWKLPSNDKAIYYTMQKQPVMIPRARVASNFYDEPTESPMPPVTISRPPCKRKQRHCHPMTYTLQALPQNQFRHDPQQSHPAVDCKYTSHIDLPTLIDWY